MVHLRTLIRRTGRRGAFLIFLFVLDIVYGFGLYTQELLPVANSTFVFFNEILPLKVWGCIWAGVGAICLVHAFRFRDSIGYGAAMALKVTWGSVMFLGWLLADVDRGWLSATVWWIFAATVGMIATWPEEHKAGRS